MISIADDVKILFCTQPIDMRKSINGLIVLVVETLKQDPQSKHLYLFYSKNRDKIKAILWDKNGFVLLYKKMEKQKFIFPKNIHEPHLEIDSHLLKWLLQGFDFYRLKEDPVLPFTRYF